LGETRLGPAIRHFRSCRRQRHAVADLFETRLKLVEQYDRSGFRFYHIARPLLCRRQRRDRHHLFRVRFRFRLIALRRTVAFPRAVRERGYAGLSLNKQRTAGGRDATVRRREAYRLLSYNDFGMPKCCFSFGRGSNVASVPEPRHFILAL